jgi:hypothetical protein
MHMKIRRCLILVIGSWYLMFVVGAASLQKNEKPEWKYISKDERHGWGNYYDSKRVIRTGAGVTRVLVKGVPVYKDDDNKKVRLEKLIQNREWLGFKTNRYQDYSYSVTVVEIKCETNEGRSVSIVDYDKVDKELGKNTLPAPEWAPISPRSWINDLLPEVCNLKK